MSMMEPSSATSPRPYGSLWSKRSSPFGSLMTKPRVFSFRYYRGMKSSFFRRRGIGGGGVTAGGLFSRYPSPAQGSLSAVNAEDRREGASQ